MPSFALESSFELLLVHLSENVIGSGYKLEESKRVSSLKPSVEFGFASTERGSMMNQRNYRFWLTKKELSKK